MCSTNAFVKLNLAKSSGLSQGPGEKRFNVDSMLCAPKIAKDPAPKPKRFKLIKYNQDTNRKLLNGSSCVNPQAHFIQQMYISETGPQPYVLEQFFPEYYIYIYIYTPSPMEMEKMNISREKCFG